MVNKRDREKQETSTHDCEYGLANVSESLLACELDWLLDETTLLAAAVAAAVLAAMAAATEEDVLVVTI